MTQNTDDDRHDCQAAVGKIQLFDNRAAAQQLTNNMYFTADDHNTIEYKCPRNV